MEKRRVVGFMSAVLAALVIAIGMSLSSGGGDTSPRGALDAAEGSTRVAAGCQAVQTMLFSRCGHSVTRRVEAPGAVVGADFAGVQAHWELWRIESFSPERIEMTRELPLFCPMHQVLTVNEAGEIVLSRNAYGDGMAVTKTYDRDIGSFSDADRERLIPGLGFDTAEEAETWLSAH